MVSDTKLTSVAPFFWKDLCVPSAELGFVWNVVLSSASSGIDGKTFVRMQEEQSEQRVDVCGLGNGVVAYKSFGDSMHRLKER